MTKAALAIYDMDKTVTRRATFTPFLLHAARRLAPWRLLLLPGVAVTGLGYALKLYDRARLKELNYRLLIGHVSPERLEPVIQSFADAQVRTNILRGARERLAEDRAAGRRLVMATASYRLYAAAIAQRLGFDDVIGTEQALDRKGRVLARIDGANCYGAAKHDMILAWLEREGLERGALHIRFYSDHVSDAVVHHWADEAFATNAHQRLIDVAKVEGWEVLDWRE
ncbi:HAD-IB family phosphatase [Sphingosinicella sp. YJ22]|uniref:HAD family hydrolase n=1 Tax=Sphingosinicella sp. YJ22 TaxID=1104780 RepID=UPI00140A808C|nr:HAD-IB family phosphatase [Sphingosinicella sp. YJ22]